MIVREYRNLDERYLNPFLNNQKNFLKADRNFPYLRKRAAHLFSKTRFVAAQFEAYFRDDLWLKNARHANK